MEQVSLVPILVWVAALVCWGVSVWWGPRPILQAYVVDRLLRYLLIFPVGIQGLWAFIGHVFFPEQAAAAIGWEPSPFQFEVGRVRQSGLRPGEPLRRLYRVLPRVAVAIAVSCFLVGAGIGHVQDIVT